MSDLNADSLLNSPLTSASALATTLENISLSPPPSPTASTTSEPPLEANPRHQNLTKATASTQRPAPQNLQTTQQPTNQRRLRQPPASLEQTPPTLPPDTQTRETYLNSLRVALGFPSKLLLTKDNISNTALNQINWHGEHLANFLRYRDDYKKAILKNKNAVTEAESKLEVVEQEVAKEKHAVRMAARHQKSLQDQRTSSSLQNEHQDAIAINAARLAIAGEAYANAKTRELVLGRKIKRCKEAWRREYDVLKNVQEGIKDIGAERAELKELVVVWSRSVPGNESRGVEITLGAAEEEKKETEGEEWVVSEAAKRGARAVIGWFADRYAGFWDVDGRGKQRPTAEQGA